MNYVELARQKALKYGLDPDLFVRQIQAESSFNPNAVSPAGAIGLGQLMPATARELGVDPSNPDQNLEGAARYMRQQLDSFGDYGLALAAYNAGPSRVQKAGGIPNITETQNYVSKIMGTGGSAMNANAMGMDGLLAASKEADERYKREQAEKPLFRRDTFKDMAADMALAMNEMSLRPSESFTKAINSIKNQRTEKQARNKTVEFMRRSGRDDLAAAVDGGVLTAKEGYVTMLNDAAELRRAQAKGGTTALIRNALAAGLQPNTPEFRQFIVSGGDIYNQETQLLANLPKPEKGMRYQFDRDETGRITNYRLVPIAGSQAERDVQKAKDVISKQTEAKVTSGTTVLGDIGEMKRKIEANPTLTTGMIGSALLKMGFTTAVDVNELGETIRSNIGFDRLQRMREESPTGGALGQVAVQELNALQASLGSLKTAQSADQLIRNLERLEKQYQQSMKRILDTEGGSAYFTQNEIDTIMGAAAAPAATTSPTVTHRFNPETGKVEPVR